jgi:energy-coupling factor transport system ATP-binding protein
MKQLSKFSFGVLPPVARFVIVFAAGSLYILVNSLWGALAIFTAGLVLYLLGEKKNWKLAVSAPISGGMMLFYNSILSPTNMGGYHFLFLTVNQAGIDRGLVTGLRLTGIMLISFAWLASTSIPEMYEGIAWLKPGREWALGILRGLQIMQREFVILTQSLIMRGLKWDSIAANIRNLVPLSMAIMPRVIENAQKATFASLSHKTSRAEGNGGVIAQDLHVRYSPDSEDVLKGINLEINPGEFTYLAGKGAAGKTTLLRALGGVIPWIMGEFKGSVRSSGMVTHETALERLCGTVRYTAPDPFASIHGLTVKQEISFLARSEAEARRALEVMKIENLWNQETTKLSGGQQVRLVLAGVLASKAKVLLLDAPMQELDPQGRADFTEALSILQKERRTTVLVADPFWQELRPHCQKVLVIEGGYLKEVLSPGAFFTPVNLEACNLNEVPLKPLSVTAGNIVSRLEGVEVTLDGNHILRGIDFSVSEGELVTIVGPNGSGKTTAMLTLAEALKPSKGKVANRGRVGYIFQNAALQLLAMTVSEELAFGPKVLKWEGLKTDEFVKQSVSWTGLSPDACPLDLHPAEQRLLAIAACNTEVSTLIFDEPTIGLDSQGVTKVVELIDTLRSRGKAVVVITHDEHLARHADRVVTIEKGRISKEIRRSDLEGGDADGTHPGA